MSIPIETCRSALLLKRTTNDVGVREKVRHTTGPVGRVRSCICAEKNLTPPTQRDLDRDEAKACFIRGRLRPRTRREFTCDSTPWQWCANRSTRSSCCRMQPTPTRATAVGESLKRSQVAAPKADFEIRARSTQPTPRLPTLLS